MGNWGNWNRAEEYKKVAKDWLKYINDNFQEDTKKCQDLTTIFETNINRDVNPDRLNKNGTVGFIGEDSVSAMKIVENDLIRRGYSNNKLAMLNFASFKVPGGAFLKGASAQEDILCHYSNLWDVLSSKYDSFYAPNQNKLHGGLYEDRLIYSPNVLFIDRYEDMDCKIYCDVITCAAPNNSVAIKYQKVSEKQVYQAMKSRIDALLYSAYANNVDSLILGAFGCGVFKNDPEIVASLFADALNNKYRNAFHDVIFAIPYGDDNYRVFNRVIIERMG